MIGLIQKRKIQFLKTPNCIIFHAKTPITKPFSSSNQEEDKIYVKIEYFGHGSRIRKNILLGLDPLRYSKTDFLYSWFHEKVLRCSLIQWRLSIYPWTPM